MNKTYIPSPFAAILLLEESRFSVGLTRVSRLRHFSSYSSSLFYTRVAGVPTLVDK